MKPGDLVKGRPNEYIPLIYRESLYLVTAISADYITIQGKNLPTHKGKNKDGIPFNEHRRWFEVIE